MTTAEKLAAASLYPGLVAVLVSAATLGDSAWTLAAALWILPGLLWAIVHA